MAKLEHLKITHFRGIESFEQRFDTGITCIIGRGDSGKSTILDAIAYLFAQSWTVRLNDSDFNMCDTSAPIIIEGTVSGFTEDDGLLQKFEKHIRGILPNGTLVDDMESEEATTAEPVLTIRLTVGKDLEPIWEVVSYNGELSTPIKAVDRGKLNVYAVSDYTDRHFSMNKGNPLYSLYKQLNGAAIEETDNAVLDVVRDAKAAFDAKVGDSFNAVIGKVKEMAALLGITLNEMKAMLDHRDIAISENKVSIHEDGIPFRLKGKGSKRLLSLAIQLALTEPSGVILIDEIEQGLEPDRVMHLVNVLAKKTDRQIIITTHSNNVMVEIPCTSLYVMRKEEGRSRLLHVEGEIQGCIRRIPEAFFAAKVLVCEGATEVGLCKAINQQRINSGKVSAVCKGVFFADGWGRNMFNYAPAFRDLDYPTALVCDSDEPSDNAQKPELVDKKVDIFDWENDLSIEEQVFKDVPWDAVKELLPLAVEKMVVLDGKTREEAEQSIFDCTNSFMAYKMTDINGWYDQEIPELRPALGRAAKKKKTMEWYKSQTYGELMGNVILKYYDQLAGDCRLKEEIDKISNWMDS